MKCQYVISHFCGMMDFWLASECVFFADARSGVWKISRYMVITGECWRGRSIGNGVAFWCDLLAPDRRTEHKKRIKPPQFINRNSKIDMEKKWPPFWCVPNRGQKYGFNCCWYFDRNAISEFILSNGPKRKPMWFSLHSIAMKYNVFFFFSSTVPQIQFHRYQEHRICAPCQNRDC